MPSHQNAVQLFDGDWASDLAEVLPDLPHAGVPMFHQDRRPAQAAAALGHEGRLDGMHVLEVGPLEGAHSYQLEMLGAARITAVEANADAFMRCLVLKNALSLDRTTFYLGDCSRYLQAHDTSYDLIFASGVLYHMEDPIEFLRLIARRTRRLFIWSHYFDASFRFANGRSLQHRETIFAAGGLRVPLYALTYGDRFRSDFFGGNKRRTHWLSLDGILTVLGHYGFDEVDLIENIAQGERGPAVTLAAKRTREP